MIKLNSSLRISVIDNCNFSCLYCPRNENMENYCPKHLRQNRADTFKFLEFIENILECYAFTKIVITGGEPLLCDDLEIILKKIKEYENYVELDTNGSLYDNTKWNKIKKYVDGVKISLDSLDSANFAKITNTTNKNYLQNIKDFISCIKEDNIPVTINCVCTKLNVKDIDEIVNFCVENSLDLSLLDLYFTKETEEFWKSNYIDIEILKKNLAARFGKIIHDDSFGCDFDKLYYNAKNYIKFKSSSKATMRDSLCDSCNTYCQEGIFCLRLSRQGWVTVCQSNEDHGVLLTDGGEIESLIDRILKAKPDKQSFEKMLKANRVKNDH